MIKGITMRSWWDGPGRTDALLVLASGWLGAPFVPRGTSRQGVDCISLVAMIYKAAGALGKYSPPPYKMDSGSHLEDSLLEAELVKDGTVKLIWRRPPEDWRAPSSLESFVRPGDVLVGKRGRVTHHAAIALCAPLILHAVATVGVCYASLSDPIVSRGIETVYRKPL